MKPCGLVDTAWCDFLETGAGTVRGSLALGVMKSFP